ncbi:T9SS type A sorting domain-containing protein [Williamwhitmania taraxaci]|uniref:Por secretion system C-terminal sorting domain-containing protein n=1 Tax=Williamwhitmania taraxaci TaxID=1640674 RepID=A0A1G6HQB0_9BACT|nr:T9SS type A sorting domain-containing protein [Williamwhitmania taraxaci]SDB96430.1 Por secretion system C-terminal sorting domain-containing protein [Williamwhitmania taraxaci]
MVIALRPLKSALRLTVLITLFFSITPCLMAADPPFLTEGFESGTIPTGWTREFEKGTVDWRYRNGGYSPNDPNYIVPASASDPTRNPSSAHGGTYNALFQEQSVNNERTKLVTKAINLSTAIKPQLRFWLAQVGWTFGGGLSWDAMRVYYKNTPGGAWTLLKVYDYPIDIWTEVSLYLPNPTSTYYLAFEGHTQWGLGTCIDDIVIEEKGNLNKFVKSVTPLSVPTEFIPSGSNNNPVLGFEVAVSGNQSTCIFDSVEVKSLNTDDANVTTNGVKLFRTSAPIFDASTQVSTASLVGGYAKFDNLNIDLPSGSTYFWITYDILTSAQHGNQLDAMIEAKSIGINDTAYAPTAMSPAGYRVVYETIFNEDFETDNLWTLTGEFERNTPSGLGGSPGNPDPATAHSGSKVLGTDLTGLGTVPYNYEAGITRANAYKATSKTFNVFFYKDLKLTFQRYLNIFVEDSASVDVSKDDGLTWTRIGGNITPTGLNAFIVDNKWTRIENSIPGAASRSKTFKLRFALNNTSFYNYSGWNIDDLILTGDYITKDVTVTEWVTPISRCGFGAAESITIKVANLSAMPTPNKVPLAISLDGGVTWVRDTIRQVINSEETLTYTILPKFDFSSPGPRNNVLVKTELPGDEEPANDQLSYSFYAIPTYATPYTQDFESSSDHWRSTQGNLWEYGTPAKTTINSAYSGSKTWISKFAGSYGTADPSDVVVAYFDNFENSTGWTLTGEFQIGTPTGGGNEDGGFGKPGGAFAGVKVLGTDLTGLGTNPFRYEANINSNSAYAATTPTIDLSGFSSASVSFYRQLNVADGDTAKIQVTKNGIKWYTLWKSEGEITIGADELTEYALPDSLLSTTFQLRFAIAYSNGTVSYSGWVIDNFTISGNQYTAPVAILESPCFNFTSVVKPMFSAYVNHVTEKNIDGAALYYSIDGGTSWTTVGNNGNAYDSRWNWYKDSTVAALGVSGWTGTSHGWYRVAHLLPAIIAGQSSVKFQIRFKADRFNNEYDGIAFDDIRFVDAPNDFGVSAFVSPISACTLASNESVTLKVKNFGIRTAKTGESIGLRINVNRDGNIQSANQLFAIPSDLAVNGEMNFTLSQRFDFSLGGTYNITASTYGEEYPLFYYDTQNDTLLTTVVVNKPYVNLGNTVYTVRPDTLVFDATSAGAIDYRWYSPITSTTPLVTVPDAVLKAPLITMAGGEFRVEVEGGCTAYDTVKIVKLTSDIGLTEITSPVSACELTGNKPFVIKVKNFGTDTLQVGDTVVVSWTVNAGTLVTENVKLTAILLPNAETTLTTIATTNFSAINTYNIEMDAKRPYDETPGNNHKSSVIVVHGFPSFTLSPHFVYQEVTTYLFDAGIWSSYLWHDGSTNQTFTMDTIGWVKVTVTDAFGCPASDSSDVHLKFTDIGLESIISPADLCRPGQPVYPQVIVHHYGTDTLAIGSKINVGYKLNNVTIVTDQVTLNQQSEPGNTFNHTFTIPVDLSTEGTYKFIYWAEAVTNEMRRFNDTLKRTINVYTPISLFLPPKIVTRAAQVILDGGTGYDTYLWSTGETTQTITVTTSDTYTLIVTKNAVCTATASTEVIFVRHDYQLTQFVAPLDLCANPAGQNVSVRLFNNGNDTLKTNQQLSIKLFLEGSLVEEKIFQPTTMLLPATSVDVTFTQPLNVVASGVINLSAELFFASDILASNNTTSKTLNVWPNPVVNLGPDQLLTSGSTVLDAGSGFSQYLWNTGATTQTITVSVSGTYTVTVTSDKGCQGSDQVVINFAASAMTATALITPLPGCIPNIPLDVKVEFTNLSLATLLSGTKIPVGYQFNSGVTQVDTLLLVADLPTSGKVSHTFKQKATISSAGNKSFKAFTYFSLTQGPVSDFLIEALLMPVFKFSLDTIKVSAFPYLLTATGGNSYLWSNGNTTASTLAATPDKYWVQVSLTNGCSVRDTIVVLNINSIGENEFITSLRYYPVPASYELNVETTLKANTDVTIEIVDITGVVIWHQKYGSVDRLMEKIPLNNFKPGTYILRLLTPEGNASNAFIINK